MEVKPDDLWSRLFLVLLIGVFTNKTKLAIMPILSSLLALLPENKNIQRQNVTLSRDRTQASHEPLILALFPILCVCEKTRMGTVYVVFSG